MLQYSSGLPIVNVNRYTCSSTSIAIRSLLDTVWSVDPRWDLNHHPKCSRPSKVLPSDTYLPTIPIRKGIGAKSILLPLFLTEDPFSDLIKIKCPQLGNLTK